MRQINKKYSLFIILGALVLAAVGIFACTSSDTTTPAASESPAIPTIEP